MEEKLVTLIAHLVYSGMDIEQALERGREYVRGYYLQGYAFMIVSPREAECIKSDAQTLAEETIAKVILKAWIAVEQLHKADDLPKRQWSREEIVQLLEPYKLKGVL